MSTTTKPLTHQLLAVACTPDEEGSNRPLLFAAKEIDNQVLTDPVSKLMMRIINFLAQQHHQDPSSPVDSMTLYHWWRKGAERYQVAHEWDDFAAFEGYWCTSRLSLEEFTVLHRNLLRDAERARLVKSLMSLAQQVQDTPLADLDACVQKGMQELVRYSSGSSSIRSLAQLAGELQQFHQDLKTGDIQDLGIIPTGIRDLDQALQYNGLVPGDLIIVGSPPANRKTSLVSWILLNAVSPKTLPLSVRPPHWKPLNAGFISLEMGLLPLALRLEAQYHSLPLNKINVNMEGAVFDKLTKGLSEFSRMGLFFETKARTEEAILRAIYRLVEVYGCKLIAIDYLQLMKPAPGTHQSVALEQMAQALKDAAKDLNIPIIAISSLNREGQKAGQGDNNNTHLKYAIEFAADVIMLVRCGASYQDIVGVECVLTKNRNGPLATIPLLTHAPSFTFFSPSPKAAQQQVRAATRS